MPSQAALAAGPASGAFAEPQQPAPGHAAGSASSRLQPGSHDEPIMQQQLLLQQQAGSVSSTVPSAESFAQALLRTAKQLAVSEELRQQEGLLVQLVQQKRQYSSSSLPDVTFASPQPSASARHPAAVAQAAVRSFQQLSQSAKELMVLE